LDINTTSWVYNGYEDSGVRPPPRYAHATTSIDPVSFAIYGGSSFLSLLGDLWIFSHRNEEGWRKLYPGPGGAEGRSGGLIELAVGSGLAKHLPAVARSAVLYLSSICIWLEIDPEAPYASFGAAAAYSNGEIYIVGGMGYDFVPGAQVYGYNIAEKRWTVSRLAVDNPTCTSLPALKRVLHTRIVYVCLVLTPPPFPALYEKYQRAFAGAPRARKCHSAHRA
jgi:hypothetical protein